MKISPALHTLHTYALESETRRDEFLLDVFAYVCRRMNIFKFMTVKEATTKKRVIISKMVYVVYVHGMSIRRLFSLTLHSFDIEFSIFGGENYFAT